MKRKKTIIAEQTDPNGLPPEIEEEIDEFVAGIPEIEDFSKIEIPVDPTRLEDVADDAETADIDIEDDDIDSDGIEDADEDYEEALTEEEEFRRDFYAEAEDNEYFD